MNRGIYRCGAAMMTELRRQDIHTNNLANVSTNGFKRSLGKIINGGDPQEAGWVSASTDLSNGPIESTNSPLDLALESSGFFVVQGVNGPEYTRNGHFTRDASGFMCTTDGRRVLGAQGPINLGQGDVAISTDGWVQSNGKRLDRLQVVDYNPGDILAHEQNASLTATRAPQAVETYTVQQGAIEHSNVSAMVELGAIRSGFRVYEANARIIEQTDRSLQKLIEAAGS